MKKRRWLWLIASAVGAVLVFVLGCQWLIIRAASGRLYDEVNAVPGKRLGVVLGCAKTLAKGRPNPFFDNRIKAAAELYKAGKIGVFIVSGDNHRKGYDEPTDMRQALVEAGVPQAKIACDYAGFRTLDSIARVKKIFHQDHIIVISQRFHNERALYLAKCYGMDAIAFNAADVGLERGLKTYVREVFARVKAVLDVHVLRTKPKFYEPQFEPVKIFHQYGASPVLPHLFSV